MSKLNLNDWISSGLTAKDNKIWQSLRRTTRSNKPKIKTYFFNYVERKTNPAFLLLTFYFVIIITCLVSSHAKPYKGNLNDITWSRFKAYKTFEDYEVDKSGDKLNEKRKEKVFYCLSSDRVTIF